MPIAIINAMQKEHERLASLLTNAKKVHTGSAHFVEGRLDGKCMVLSVCGIGKVNAAVGAVEMIRRYNPQAIVNTGVAGGLDKSLHVMDIVAGARVAYHDVDCGPEAELGQVQGLPKYFEASPTLLAEALQAKESTKVEAGLIVSGDRFITKQEDLAQIKSLYPDALAVDMESGAIAQVCHLYGVPFLSLRIVSDTPGGTDHFAQYTNFWGEMAERSFEVTRKVVERLTRLSKI